MTTIMIQAEEEIINALKQVAKRKFTTTDAIIKEALLNYFNRQHPGTKKYSFIGIGHSKKGNSSTQVDAILNKAADRREGWSFKK